MNVGILGGYQTVFGELWDKDIEDLVKEAFWGALNDSGSEVEEIEAVFVGSMLSSWVLGQNHLGGVVNKLLGTHVPVVGVESACASGGVAVAEAVAAIESGRYEKVLVLGVEKMTDVDSAVVAEALMGAASVEERESGVTFPGLYAMMARSYMAEYGLTREDLALVPVKNHKHGALNEKAHFPFEISLEQVITSSCVASPLTLFDSSGISDGAAALVLGEGGGEAQVEIVGSGQAGDCLDLAGRESLTSIKATQVAADKAYAMAGVESKSVDVAEIHDCFSIAEILAYEDLGFAKKGEAASLLKSKDAWLGGKCPMNTSGGLKACGHPVGATGVKQVYEIYKQLLGEAGKRQVDGARVGLAHNVGGSGGTAVVHILKKSKSKKQKSK